MYLGNLLKSGDYVNFVPIGIPITLVYDDRGILHKVYNGYKDTKQDITKTMLRALQEHSIVPSAISIKQGTSTVTGVLYKEHIYPISANSKQYIHYCITHFEEDATQYKFYAINIESDAQLFRGAMSTRQWLSYAAFELVPGALIPSNMTPDKFDTVLKSSNYTFNNSILSYYVIYRDAEVIYHALEYTVMIITSIKVYMDENGYIMATVYDSKCGQRLTTNYSKIVENNLHKADCIVVDTVGDIYCANVQSGNAYDTVYICPYCGNSIQIHSDIEARCDNYCCRSRLYPRILHMQHTLGLLPMPKEVYDALIKTESLLSITDIFEFEEYSHPINVSLDTLLRAYLYDLPFTDITITKLINYSNNSISNLNYNIEHWDSLDTDKLEDSVISLAKWFSSSEVYLEWQTLCNIPNITIDKQSRKFEGAPIFRNTKLYITGDFIHGSTDEVCTILRSYDAEVTTTFSADVNCVITGSLYENINGQSLVKARSTGIPIIDECDFFRKFEIDKDLATHGVM